jgi:3-dehydroquinate synthase
MSESFEIRSSLKSYRIRIGTGLFRLTDAQSDDLFVVSDAGLAQYWPQLTHPRNIGIEAVESAKTLDTVARVIEQMRRLGAQRQSRMIAVGGGIVQDVATFCAACYMRGIDWSYYPTTLLGMVDSCIGGKSSINVGAYKNIAGNYYPPDEIVIDTDFCRTLPRTEQIAGLCEAAKICFAHRDDSFERYLGLTEPQQFLQKGQFGEVIALSLRTKKHFIEADEFDQGERLLLNFGHTFGHAIEGASGYAITHGVAVGLGMLAALHMSKSLGLFDTQPARAQALAQHVEQLLRHVAGLSEAVLTISPAAALDKFKSDKKHRKTQYAVVLVDGGGYLVRHFIPVDPNSEALIMAAFESIRRPYS